MVLLPPLQPDSLTRGGSQLQTAVFFGLLGKRGIIDEQDRSLLVLLGRRVIEALWNSGIAIIAFLQGLGDWLTPPMLALTFLGRAEFYLLVMPLIYWCVDYRLGLRLAVVLLVGASLNDALKIACHAPRPLWLAPHLKALATEVSFGLPSGHAQHALSVWGLLANSLRRRWAWAAVLMLSFLIGLSRVYLAVHFPSDVLAGWLVGALWLWLFLRGERRLGKWIQQRSLGQGILLSCLLSLASLGLVGLSLLSLGDWQLPDDWLANALAVGQSPAPLRPVDGVNAAGALLGFVAGVAWLKQRGGFASHRSYWQRLACALVGLLGSGGLWYGTGVLLPTDAAPLSFALYYWRAVCVGLWIAVGAPLLFIRLGWVERKDWS